MRPLEGVVISTSAMLLIRLKSGAIISISKRKDLKLGDTCFILFDYTRLKIAGVWSEKEYHHLEDISGPEDRSEKPPDWEKCQQWLDESEDGPVVSL